MSTSRATPSLKRRREREGLTQEQVAEKARIGVRTIQRLEAGGVARYDMLERIAEVLSVSVDELCEPPPKTGGDTVSPSGRWEVIPVSRITRGAELLDLIAGRHASHLSRIAIDLDEDRDLVAQFEQELQDDLDIVRELSPIARRDCERSLDERMAELHERGLGVVAGCKSYLLSLPLTSAPSPPAGDTRWYVAYIAVGPEGNLPAALMRDRAEPLV